MIAAALFYYQFHSAKNRLLTRIRRLRQPKYLVGAIVAALYFYSYVFRGFRRAGAGGVPWLLAPEHRGLAEPAAALLLLVMLLLAWVLPHSRAALTFSEAEIAFLFPAPVGRRTLLHFKLLKSQAAILLSSLFMTLLGRGVGGGNFLMRALDWWALLSVFNLHLLGSSFAVTLLMDRGISNWKRRLLFLGGAVGLAAALVLWARQSIPPPPLLGADALERLSRYAQEVFQLAPVAAVLFPFRLVIAPFFAASFPQFLLAFAPALAIIGLHYWWVMRCNVAFEEASVELSRTMADRIAAVRAGPWQTPGRPAKAARAPFKLRPGGSPVMALLWKNLVSAGRLVTGRMWVLALWLIVVTGSIWQGQASRHINVGATVGFLALTFTVISLFSGPQLLRNDLRQDLPAADVLKMFPMPGWQIVLGEILAPAAMLAGVQWLLLAVAVVFSPAVFGHYAVTLGVRMGFGLAAAIVLPFIDLIAMLIPNASVLFFPAWFQLGKEAPRGFETTGQQLILMFGQVLVLALSLIPAAGVFAVIVIGGSYVLAPSLSAVLASVAAAVILALEAALGLKLLGAVFERFDLSSEIL